MRRFNDWFAEKVTNMVGTMYCAYLFTGLTFISLPNVIETHDPIVIVTWVAQSFLQLVLLPIIMVGQDLHSKKLDAIHEHVTKEK